ncbi:MAG TPA: ribosome biogenesis GTPase Der [Clostridia bacterium]|nr:ribosome biogenesis GTPase Der [Clostridia bacterium]
MKPVVAIVGRPNVGKSTLFNRIIGKRLAITEDIPGVTRDRIFSDAEWAGREFTVVDTGGLDPKSEDVIFVQMYKQAQLAIEMANVILFMVDAKQGLMPDDHDVANVLRQSNKPVLLVMNKADNKLLENELYEFFSLGFGDPIAVSALQGLGIGDLLDKIVEELGNIEAEPEDKETLKIAVVGKPNVGKSSLVNKILNEERVIVSDIPGTTRDAIDTYFEQDGRKYCLIDTAGLRRKRSVKFGTVESYSVIRTLGAIRRCDVAVVMLDATQELSEQDIKVAGYVHEQGKPSVIVVNKWDAVEKDTNTMDKMKKSIISDLAFMDYARVLFISAKTGSRVDKIFPAVQSAYEQSTRRISTGLLNDILQDALIVTPPPSDKGRRLKIYYVSQVAVSPPLFALFVNDTEAMHFSYLRFLENHFRKSFGFEGTPIRFALRQKDKE